MPVSIAAARRLALAFPGAVEMDHWGRPSFRVGAPGSKKPKIFATLWPDERRVVAILAPEEQEALVEESPGTYIPVNGTWGIMGATFIELARARESDVRNALRLAWLKAAPKGLRAGLTSKEIRTRVDASRTTSTPKRLRRSAP